MTTDHAPRPPADEPPLLVSDHDGVRTLTLNRPAAFNSFDLALKGALLTALTSAAEDDTVRALVITGAGRAFCAGQDLKQHLELVKAEDPRIATTVREFYNVAIALITGMGKPVIAAVNGAAAGAGAAFAYACDLRVASSAASFSMAFAGVGLSADSGASYTLPRLIGTGRAARMMLLGERVDAAEALRIGMVDEVVPPEDLMPRVAALAGALATGPTKAYAWIKASMEYAATSDLPAALEFEGKAQAELFFSADHHEAISAFAEKRVPRFLGR
ncbi:enoyl-CoA hydratase/isomerase family protein [Nakamurella sp. PAMC28650]|uniref:enoyl-CoA hydratase/isomerase family protein n=1 Tax=Nakamurella sp. PAMC28650 TaxID=2762325 RepID=UPI00164DD179|nr:enoyl-CoA hydratase-related protein [Nakamurella sp. PAMC28650]QNK80130.1 enoyl-CoA hydratase/isomerase family protein [Nakamurella sp. PAMC28650]